MTAMSLGLLMAINPALGLAAMGVVYVVLFCAFGIAMRRIRKRRRALDAELLRRATQPRPSTVEMEPTGADGGGLPE